MSECIEPLTTVACKYNGAALGQTDQRTAKRTSTRPKQTSARPKQTRARPKLVVYKPRGARYGGIVAAPVFKNIIEHTLVYLNIPMEREDNHVFLVSSSH